MSTGSRWWQDGRWSCRIGSSKRVCRLISLCSRCLSRSRTWRSPSPRSSAVGIVVQGWWRLRLWEVPPSRLLGEDCNPSDCIWWRAEHLCEFARLWTRYRVFKTSENRFPWWILSFLSTASSSPSKYWYSLVSLSFWLGGWPQILWGRKYSWSLGSC